MGEAKRKRLLKQVFQTGNATDLGWGATGVTTVGAVYRSATFSARIDIRDVPKALQEVDAALKRHKAGRTHYLDAKDHVVTALSKNEHMTEEGGYVMAMTLLWCFCRGSQLADYCRFLAEQGGSMFVFEITGEVPGQANFRTILGDADAHPLAHLFPDPRDIPTVGRA